MEKTRKKCFSTKSALYVEGQYSVLKICKKTKKLSTLAKDDREFASCVLALGVEAGEVCDILGKIEIEGHFYVLYVSEASVVARFYDKNESFPIYRVDRVRALPLIEDDQFSGFITENKTPPNSRQGHPVGNVATQAANKFKLGQKAFMKFVTNKIPDLLDEILRLFNDVPDFYYCHERDITHSTQRHFEGVNVPDERFFWNKNLLNDLLRSEFIDVRHREWIIPIVQGFIQNKELYLEDCDKSSIPPLCLTLISRRSVHRAGARYLRRGIDDDGYVANFVESELLLNIFGHHVSFIQIRGSIPLFWSQQGLHYRPPLTITRTMEDSLLYFEKHVHRLTNDYGNPICMVNLVNQSGRELKLGTSFLEHVIAQDSENVEFFSFDFHHHCRGLNFDKVLDLVAALEPSLKEIGFCWIDKMGEIVRKQKGIVRTNCVDCLDRTNVVQGSISQMVCFGQARRLGLFGPLNDPPDSLVSALQLLWADNGDSISTQYAGTAALKGDMTRYGERKITGIMKDGYNSASRYYLSHMRDARRQKAMNALLGVEEEIPKQIDEIEDESDEDANVGRLVLETAHFLLPENEILIGGWALVDARNSTSQCDSVLLLTRISLYVAFYDDDAEKLLEVKIVPLEEINAIEIGRTSRTSRIHVRVVSSQGSWVFRAGETRLFSNVPIRIKNNDEADEYIQSIAEQLKVTMDMVLNRTTEITFPQRITTGEEGAKKKIAQMFSMLGKVRFSKSQPTNAEKSNNNERTKIPDLLTPDVEHEHRPSSVVFMDEQIPQADMRTSESDSHLVGLVSRLKGLRGVNSNQSQSLSPFTQLIPKIDKCKPKIVLLHAMNFRTRALLALLCGLATVHWIISYCPDANPFAISSDYEDPPQVGPGDEDLVFTNTMKPNVDRGAQLLDNASENSTFDANLTAIVHNPNMFTPQLSSLPYCPPHPPNLVGPIRVYMDEPKIEDMEKIFNNLEKGGHGTPSKCFARHRVAIIVPFRDRLPHLKILLHNLIDLLQKQQIDFAIFAVEPLANNTFNRAKLMNIGYVEALRLYPWTCFIFHDVDLMPEDDRNLYSCPQQPRHMSVAIDKFGYSLPYRSIFGGISGLTKEHMQKMNGFSNSYWGWGGEDDDMSSRVVYSGYKISRYPKAIARYKMIKHNEEKKSNPVNPCRHKLMAKTRIRWHKDGLADLNYDLIQVDRYSLYTRILVDMREKESRAQLAKEGFPRC
ncbi:unnamed protein product, partial [Mesorhabditis belari]|uniref:SAC domain-containing protein n=1 Tax=Mesorhabditis belari TaxID=2138241 RepID=A0AAF3FDW3_9BILA